MVDITFKFEEQEFDVPPGFKLSKKLNLKNMLYCVEFCPPIKHDSKLLNYVHLTDFTRTDDEIMIFPSKTEITLPKNVANLRMSVVKPDASPLPRSLNPTLTSSKGGTFAQVFYLPNEAGNSDKNMKHIASLGSSTKWSALRDKLVQILRDNQLGHYGVSIGIVKDKNKLPDFESIDSFFAAEKSYLQGSKVTILVLSSFKDITFRIGSRLVSVENLSSVPKEIIRAIHARRPDHKYSTIERRTIKACLNGGVPLNLIDGLSLDMTGNEALSTASFEPFVLNLDRFGLGFDEALNVLNPHISDLAEHLHSKSPEAAFRTLFWDPIFNHCLRHGVELEHPSEMYQIKPEWNTRTLFPKKGEQLVDYVITFRMAQSGKVFPILLAEMGKARFDFKDRPPKDQSKVHSLASQSVIEQAYALKADGKDPKHARIFGMWVGGTTVQFLVAEPIITEIPGSDGMYEIHANLTIDPNWFMDLSLAAPTTSEEEPSASNSETIETETLSAADYPMLFQGTFEDDFDPIVSEDDSDPIVLEDSSDDEGVNIEDLSATHSQDDDEENEDEDNEETEDENNEDEDVGRSTESEDPQEETVQVDQGERLAVENINAVKKIYAFMQYIKSHIVFLNSAASNYASDSDRQRNFREKGEFGILVPSIPSSNVNTPYKDATKPAFARESQDSSRSPVDNRKRLKTNTEVVHMTKSSLTELQILRKLTMFPAQFPVLFDYLVEDGPPLTVQYAFEKLLPIFDSSYRYTLNPVIRPESGDPIETFYGCLCFALESSFSLYILHEQFGHVHSDISLTNIMYSEMTGTWKLLDFDQSMTVEESEKTERIAGTRDFVAPESAETKIFNKASDVFSLGKVLDGLFFGLVLEIIGVEEYDLPLPENIVESGHKFLDLTTKMIAPLPANRPAIWDIVEKLHNIMDECFDHFTEHPLYPTVHMLVLEAREKRQMEKEKSPAAVEEEKESVLSPFAAMELDPKRPRVVKEEKEPEKFIPEIQ